MSDLTRRQFLKSAATLSSVSTFAGFPAVIQRALALPAQAITRSIRDIQHIVILMQENRSFDHYFGTLRGVRGFRDRHPVPLASGKPVWYQSDGEREIPPFHYDTVNTSALRTPGTPHTFADAQAAWNQGRCGLWPKFKTPFSMAHYRREDIPFQFALAEAFTICDAHHCSVTTGTDPNRIVFWSGSNFDPERCRRGENCTERNAEVNNLRCVVKGALPAPGYTYQGSAFTWPTIPEVLEQAGISWRIYQDPNDNWAGLMHGALAFKTFRESKPGSPIYEKGMMHRFLDGFAEDVQSNRLPQVSWILPSQSWSEHPSGSSSLQGAEFTSRILEALTSNPDVWGRTVLFLTFDENDGLFDHAPPPSPPSLNPDGTLAGKSTLNLAGEYFSDPECTYRHPGDPIDSTVRPWGLGPRVPIYVISPWSRGGWVNSQVFDHTSVGQFLEKRFGITVPAISPWHRAVCGDLTSTLDFANPNGDNFPPLPHVREAAATIAAAVQRPKPTPPESPEPLFQERGVRRSRALPYELHVTARMEAAKHPPIKLTFRNAGQAGAVFHVYDRLHLDRIPRRYTVEAGKSLEDSWALDDPDKRYDLWVYGPNGFVRELRGNLISARDFRTEIALEYDLPNRSIRIISTNEGHHEAVLEVRANAYPTDGPGSFRVPSGGRLVREWSVITNHGWYDFTITGEHFQRRFAGRMETGAPSFSDPAV